MRLDAGIGFFPITHFVKAVRSAISISIPVFDLLIGNGCRKESVAKLDSPRLTSKVRLQDVRFRSAALPRELSYRVVLPISSLKSYPQSICFTAAMAAFVIGPTTLRSRIMWSRAWG